MSEIILYDIPRKVPEDEPWSPNTLKTRLALKFKGLPFKTIWVEYPDIASVCQKIGAPPTTTKRDGSPMYTLPVIYDPSTQKAVADSYNITEYLEATYPATPRLIPMGTEGLHAAFCVAFESMAYSPTSFFPAFAVRIAPILNPESDEYFVSTKREQLALLSPPGSDTQEQIKTGKKSFDVVDEWYKKAGEGKLFLMGDTPSWADIVIAAYFVSARNIFGRNTKEWKGISGWHEGRWTRLMAAFDE